MASYKNISVLTSLAIGLIYLLRAISYRRRMNGAKIEPGPKGLLGETFNKWNREYGPLVQFELLGQMQIVLRTEQVTNNLFVNHDATRYEPFVEWESAYSLHDLLQTPEDSNDHLERYSYSAIYRLALSQNITSVHDEVIREASKLTGESLEAFRPDKFIANMIPAMIHALKWLVPSNRRLDDIIRRIDRTVDGFEEHIRKDVADRSAPDSWFRNFLENSDEFGVKPKDARWRDSRRHEIPHNALLAFEEVDRVAGPGRLPTFDDLPNLPTVRMIVKEGISGGRRFYEGYFIPKRTILHANYSSILSERELYPDGPVYNPHRWPNPAYPTYKAPLTEYPNLMNFPSFGYGRRACPGHNFTRRMLAVMEVVLDIRYEPTPNPKPFPFPSLIMERSREGTELVRREAENFRASDPLGKK
ncbi:cytochrome P450 [Bisporella sp. PMI_857]|nr:cytochrome P450 [Bisporella sp. PMI_857]